LSGDSSSSSNELTKEMQDRIQTVLDLQDLEIMLDLRVNNGFKGIKFDIFWDEMNDYFNEVK